MVGYCSKLDLNAMTVYLFSTENVRNAEMNQHHTQIKRFFFCRTTLTPEVDTESDAFVFLMPRSLNSY